MDDPTELDEQTLDTVPTIQGPNGLKVKIQPNGKLVNPPLVLPREMMRTE